MSKTVSQRRAELESDRFISVRNLAYATYKKPDPSGQIGPDGQVLLVPLMTYEETLTDRKVVYDTILQYELANNMIVPDDASTPATNVVALHPGVPVSQTLPPPPGFAPIPQPPAFSPQPAPVAPFIPSAAPAAPATAQQAAAAPAAAPPSAEGQPRRRRTPGTAVATPPPPPAAAPESPSFQPPAAPAAPVAAPSFPVPQQAQSQSFAFAPPAAPAPIGGTVDLAPVTQKVDQLGGVVNSLITGLEEMKKQLAASQQQNEMLLIALSHLYLVTPQTAQGAQQSGKNVGTLVGFKEYLSQYLPR